MSVVGKRLKRYTLINVCEELSGDKVTSIVFHGYREDCDVVSPIEGRGCSRAWLLWSGIEAVDNAR